ncbi:MAG: hypothetical protein ACOYXU_01985 [Nitrospirota bacterium]
MLSGTAGAVGTTIQLATLGQHADGWERGYDVVGRLVLSYRRVFNAATQQEVTIAERTSYDLRGQPQYAFHQQIIGGGYAQVGSALAHRQAHALSRLQVNGAANITFYRVVQSPATKVTGGIK